MIYACVKRLSDILIGLVGLIILIPLTVIIKLVYICTGDFHPIFYTQERIGKNGKTFKIIKYRSMIPNADESLEKLLEQKKYRDQWEEYQKLDNDPRITKVGKIIRNGSIDEFPQFVNVLLGQMSMVGPRPLVPGELKEHGGKAKDIEKYQSVKPGVTGYWAMRIRSDKNSDYDERLKLEYFYIENRGIVLDVKILFRTVGTVLRQKGAQ